MVCDFCRDDIMNTYHNGMVTVPAEGEVEEKHYHVSCHFAAKHPKIRTVGDMITVLSALPAESPILIRRVQGYEYELYDDDLPFVQPMYYTLNKEGGLKGETCDAEPSEGSRACIVLN